MRYESSLWRLALALLVAYARKPWRARRHRACLRRIEELEIAVGLREAPDRYGPGAVWTVNDPRDIRPLNYTQARRNPYAAVIHKHNLTRSAFYAVLEKSESQ